MDVRKRKSGAAYRKAAKLKKESQNAVVMSCKSIKDMFRSHPNLSTNKSRLLNCIYCIDL